MTKHFDVLIIGAGLSGIGSAYHLQTNCPDKTYTILESRTAIGGTWDLFRYPGIRSDSDMYTFSYSFKPWKSKKTISDGQMILDYIKETAQEFDIEKHIRFSHKVVEAEWSSKDAQWSIKSEVNNSKKVVTYTANFLLVCSGYYDYENGYTPKFEGMETYCGEIVHPQKWRSSIDYTDKKVIVIGSGATAITLAPTLAKKAAHVTMLQRSPSYVLSVPSEDKIANFLHRIVPSKIAHTLARYKNIFQAMFFYSISRKKPKKIKQYLSGLIKKELGKDYAIDPHFNPRYNPWDQRVCIVPDNDLFKAIKEDKLTVVTDHITTFNQKGIELKSGKKLEADLIITATGLQLKFAGGINFIVDDQQLDPSKLISYKGSMFSNVPNFVGIVGYTNASWTLKSDLVGRYVCRLLNYMDKHDKTHCVPRLKNPKMETISAIDFSSSYVLRALDYLPKQGAKFPWKLDQNYLKDTYSLKYSNLEDQFIEFI